MPGEEKALPFFVPHAKLGLTLASDDPLPEAAAKTWQFSLEPSAPVTLDLEYFDQYELSVYCAAGDIEMTIGPVGGAGGTIAVSPGEAHTGGYTYAKCPSVTFESDGNAVVKVKQESIARRELARRGAF
jgi:hypothetical protein